MTKIDIGRIFETSKILQTKAGQETQEGWAWLSDFGERVIRALRNGLNMTDNFDGITVDVELPHDTDQIIDAGIGTPAHIVPTRVIFTGTTITIRDFGWRIDQNGEVVVKCAYGNTTETLSVRLLIFYS